METDEFTADYTVTATSTAGSGMVDVSWTRSEELSLSLVSLIQGDKVVDFNITPGILRDLAKWTLVNMMSPCSRSDHRRREGWRNRLRNRDGGINEKCTGAASQVLN